MRAPQERTVRDLYDRTRLKDLALPEESSEGRASGRRVEGPGHREVVAAKMMESKLTSRKRPADSPIVKVESGTCNVCCSPCSSCLHRNIAITDSNMDCGSSQTCCARSETKNSSFLRSDKGLHGKGKGGENDDEFSATSSPASYTENGENKVVARSSVAADSEVDKPAKRRRLINHGSRSPRIECHDDSNSCVTGVSAAGKLLLDKKKDKLSMSASSRDLTVNCKDNSFNSQNRLRIFFIEESSGKKRSDVHVMNRSSSDRSLPAVSHSFATKKLLRTQSSLSASQGLCPKRPTHGSGNLQDNLAHQPCEKASSNKNIERSLGGKSDPSVLGAERHGTMTNCGTSSREKIKAGSLTKNIENGTSCLRIGSLERADIQSNDAVNRNDNDKQEQNQGCSMDTGNGRKLNMQNDVMTDSGNSEGLIDVNVCDICGDVGREYLLATCTRCLEGAEHTYCMRVKLEKVPDGEWLCEECHLKEEQNQTRSNDGAAKIKIFDGKNQNSETMNNPKTLKVATTDLDSGTPVTDPLSGRNQKLHLLSTDAEARQVKCTTPTAERLDGKNKNSGIMVNRKKLQVTTSGFEARHSTCSTPTSGNLDKNQSFDKKSQGSEALLNHKKLRIATDMESPLSNEGVRSPPKSFKRYAENTLSSTPRLLKTESPRKHDVLSRENSFKSSNKGSLKSPDNIPTRTPSVSSSMALPRSYSVGNLANVKKPVPSPRGLLSKQPSFNNSNNEPKVKQLAEPVVSKLKPSKHSPRDPREKGPIRKIMKSGSFKHEASVCKDSSSSKQKQSVHSSQNEKPRIVKPVKPTNLLERRASFNLQKPSIPSSPRSDSSTRTADPRNDQDNPRPGPSILKSSKKTGKLLIPYSNCCKEYITVPLTNFLYGSSKLGLVKKKHSSILSKSEKQGITDHPTSTGVVSSKGTYVVKASDPLIPVDKIENDSTDDACETPLVLVNNDNEMVIKPEVVSMPCAPVICGSDLQDIVSTSCSEEVQYEQKHLERSESGFSRSAVAIQASEDILPDCPQGCLVPYNPDNPDSKLNDMNIKQQAFVDQSAASGSSFGALVIPEQTYIWQGTFEVSRPGNSEMYDGFQAHLSTCASPKVLEVVKQLPQRITFAEVPRHSSWPLHFKEVKPNEDNIALYFFAKDVESYERAYGKLLGNMLAGDLSLTANISGIELLIFTSDKLPEKTQRWNGLLFFWGVFYAKKENSSTELLVKGMDPLELNGPVNRLVCSPNMPQSLGIDLNECPVDDFCDSAVSVEVKIKNSGASVDHEAERHSCEIHRPETACTGNILLGTPTAVPYGVHVHTGSKGECLNIKPEYQSDTQGGKRAAGRDMEEEESYYKNKAPCFAKQHTVASRSVSDEILANTQSPVSFKEVSLRHSVGPKLSEDPSDLILKRDFVLSDSSSMYKRQKTSDGKYSACTFGDGQLTSKYLSKIHPLPADQHMSLNDAQYICRVPADPCSPTKSNSDHIIHVLSSDDEDFLERRNTLNKASLKKEEGTSPLLSLSLSMASKKHNLAGSDTGDDGPLSLSLGLPGVVVSNQALEMKQFLPEKPGMNTSLLL
uniref:AIPP2-like SPOC-like domain-containing protein n=1 Tax=Leersia perrieri TaxID=77586 RepID=A0A0D9XMS9_9ORYZ